MIARIFCFISFVLIVFISHAQQSLLQTKITVNSNIGNVKQVLDFIANEYNIPFVYSDNIFDDKFFLEKQFFQIPLNDFLNEYFQFKNILFKEIGGQIVLYYFEKKTEWYTIVGFIRDEKNKEDLIGATIYLKDQEIGTVSNSYGYYTIKVPEGKHNLSFNCLGYEIKNIELDLKSDIHLNISLEPRSYNVQEVTVTSDEKNIFLESALMNMEKMDISTLQDMPGLMGENDALRNLAIFPGIQTNELSTSNINVRGGSTDQTLFLMDEANLYNASHFGGLFSVFNPDVVNNINVYKSDIPVSEGGALSSLIDVRLREGDKTRWKVSGGLGLISARASVEGPLKKDTSSMLFAFRRTYVDQVIKVLATDPDLKSLDFYFYDANLKLNFKPNKNNRFFISGYSGSDSFDQYSSFYRSNHLASLRWNHLFGTNLFSNTSFIASKNVMTQGSQEGEERLYWKSDANNFRIKSDISYYYTDVYKGSFGYSGILYSIDPFTMISETEDELFTRFQSTREQLMLNSLYLIQQIQLRKTISIDAGVRLTHMYTQPFSDSLTGLKDWFFEPHLKIGLTFNDKSAFKASYSRHVQPLHQLPLSIIGIAINRWMPANETYPAQVSQNLSLGYYKSINKKYNFSSEVYYRKMDHLIETFGDLRIVYTEYPDEYLFHSSGEAMGVEFVLSYNSAKFKAIATYDYCKALWTTSGLNGDKPYPASHTREHSVNISNILKINNRITASLAWSISSGIPFTAATGKYEILGKTYLQFDETKINTRKLPAYHRLDLSLDIASKKNDGRKWKSYWNFAIYNAYFHKNALGVAYFVPDDESGSTAQYLEPGYFYLYQFVPSVSYRFNF